MTDRRDGVVEGGGLKSAGPCHPHQAFGATTPLRCRLAESGFDKTLLFEAIQRGVQGADRTAPVEALLQFGSNGRPIRAVAQARGGGQDKVFKLTEHDYFYIVVLIRSSIGDSQTGTTVPKKPAQLGNASAFVFYFLAFGRRKSHPDLAGGFELSHAIDADSEYVGRFPDG